MNEKPPPAILTRAREMRKEPTPGEIRLWAAIRRCQIAGAKFRRQHPISTFMVDFCCLELRLIIEVDGDIHLSQQERDAERTAILEAYGYTVVRYTNDEVFQKLPSIVFDIQNHILTLASLRQQKM